MINHFTFNGTSTAQLGLIVSGVSIFGAGSRKVEKAGIPGRNGDLQIELGGFNNYTVRYTVSITKNFTTTAQQIREWLLESKGYCDLTDTYHPDEIRKACFNSDIEFTTSMLYKYGQASIQFDCLPERYLTTNTPITTTATADTTTDTTMSLNTVPTPITISLNGNTTQEGSSGKNLIPRPYYQADGTYHDVTWTTDNMGKITASGTTSSGTNFLLTDTSNFTLRAGTYTLSITGTLTGIDLRVYNGSSIVRYIARGSVNGHTTFTLLSAVGIRIYFNTANTGDTVNVSTYVQLEKGSTATAYEPHISPTNPQPIHNVSGDNTINVTGKNIAKFGEPYFTAGVNYTHTDNSINISANGTYARVGYSFKVETGKQYSISFKAVKSNGSYGIIHVDNNNSWNNSYGGFTLTTTMAEYTKTLTANTDILFIGFYVTSSMTTGSMIVNDFMIEVNSTATTYEPYTRQSYPILLPVENLFDKDNATIINNMINSSVLAPSSNAKTLYIPCKPNTTYTISKILSRRFYACTTATTPTTNVAVMNYNVNSGATVITLTTSATAQYLCVYYFLNGTDTLTEEEIRNSMQIEYGSKANHYTPYGTPPIELNKIGTYQDYIYKNGSKWYVHKETTKKTLDGTNETFSGVWGATNNGYAVYKTNMGRDRVFSYADKFVYDNVNGYATMPLYYFGGLSGARATWTFILPSTVTSVATANTWLQSNNVLIYYPLATPTNTEITDTTLINQLNNIEKAYSYNGTTNILQVSNDNGFMLAVVSLHSNNVSSNYKGEPIITVNSTGLIYFNGCVIKVNQAPMTINSQTMQAYNGTVNLNNYIEANDFPMIEPGNNVIGSEMPLTIVPNYWKL